MSRVYYIRLTSLNPISNMYKEKFTFARLRYRSGDWDTDQRMPANVLNSLVEYTTIPINTQEKVIDLGSNDIFTFPFCYLSGHKLVQFDTQEAVNFKKYVQNGGFVFVDDCNHDIDGLFAKSFEAQMNSLFGAGTLKKYPIHMKSITAFSNLKKGRLILVLN